MSKPVIKTPRGKIILTKTGKSRLYIRMEWRKEFRPRWQGRYSRAQIFVDTEVLRRSEPYTPLLTGSLIKSGILGTVPGEGEVAWIVPYAKRQYFSKRKPGSATGPLRGPRWFDRMKEMHGENIIKKARKIVGGGTPALSVITQENENG
jgi:hypothetical protein